MSKKKKNIVSRLVKHYKCMLVDENTQDVAVSIRLNLLNSLLIFALVSIIIVVSTFLTIRYSPLKNYFLPHSEITSELQYKRELLKLNERIYAIEDSLAYNQLFIKHLQKVVSGDFKATQVDSLMAKKTSASVSNDELKASHEDSIFRTQIAKEELEALTQDKKSNTNPHLLFTPVKGVLTAGYDLTEKHLAVDIAAKTGESVKAIEKGTIIFADWNPETGNSIVIRHANDMISQYKHMSKVFKKAGDEVKRGEVIATVGSTGELSTGPHLHFELWIKGKAVDPEKYIDF